MTKIYETNMYKTYNTYKHRKKEAIKYGMRKRFSDLK